MVAGGLNILSWSKANTVSEFTGVFLLVLAVELNVFSGSKVHSFEGNSRALVVTSAA